jgi:single-strand DNA-binding protein
MRSVNSVALLGNVGSEPEIRSTAGGMKVAKLSLATSRKAKETEKTEWHRLVVFDKLAELVEQYVRKSDRLWIAGRIEYSQSDDGKGGVRYWTDIVVHDMVMLGGKDARPAAPRSPFDDE